MQRVFVSSVMNGYEDERQAAREAIESLDLTPLMAETTAASADPSRTALFDLIDRADAVVLILGARYGVRTESGRSPTEDEFVHARDTKPVFVFVQTNVEHEPEQAAFIKRVQGGWTDGPFNGFFDTPAQLSLAVVRALLAHIRERQNGDAVPAATARARELAAPSRQGWGSGVFLRVIFVPVGSPSVIDAVALDDGLAERVARIARDHELVSQTVGLEAQGTSAGVTVTTAAGRGVSETQVRFAADGAVVADLDVRCVGPHDGGLAYIGLGGSVVSYPRVQTRITAASAAAQALWATVPAGERVRQVCALVAVPEATHRPLSLGGQVGTSMSMPTLPTPMQAPEPPLTVRRADIGTDETNRRLALALKQAYVDHNAVMD